MNGRLALSELRNIYDGNYAEFSIWGQPFDFDVVSNSWFSAPRYTSYVL
jgi:hypothetical protein